MTSREKYAWLQNSRTFLLDAYWPPFNPELEFDAKIAIDQAVKTNADTIRFGTMGKYALIQNKQIPLHPRLNGRDLLNELLEAARGSGIKVIAYVAVSHGLPESLIRDQRPEWGFVTDDGSLKGGVRHFGGEPAAPVCAFGKYNDDIRAFIRHVVDNYDIDGLYLDGPYYNWNMGTTQDVCQCESCQQTFLQDTGRNLPTNAELFDSDTPDDELLAVFNDWVGKKLYTLFNNINDIAKANKDLPLMFNVIAAFARPEPWERKIIGLSDGFLLESELDGLRGLGLGNYLGKLIWRYTQPHSAWPRLSTPSRENDNAKCGFETLTWGGAPIVSYAGRFCYEGAYTQPVGNLFELIKNNTDLFPNLQETKFIGIISEHRTARISEEYKELVPATYKLLQRAGLQTGIVTAQALLDTEYLGQFPALYLSEGIDLTPEMADGLRDYVSNGGVLIATGRVDSTLLTELFNVKLDDSGKFDSETERLRFWLGLWDVYWSPVNSDDKLPVQTPISVEPGDEASCLGNILTGSGKKILAPAVIKNSFGKGTSVYFTFPYEKIYLETGERKMAEFIYDLLISATTTPIPGRILSEGQVYSSLKECDNCKVCFLNDAGTGHNKAGIDLQVASPTKPVNVYSAVTGQQIEFEYENSLVSIVKHEFIDFDCVIIKY